jgi:hypothetical protein
MNGSVLHFVLGVAGVSGGLFVVEDGSCFIHLPIEEN